MSRPVWGAWIEIWRAAVRYAVHLGRAPYGARGLKYQTNDESKTKTGRAPYGARGLKLEQKRTPSWGDRRAPYGARGLKSVFAAVATQEEAVAPRMGRVD